MRLHLLFIVFVASGCGGASAGPVRQAPFDEVFTVLDTIVLEEATNDPIAEIGTFLESASGDLIIGDRMLPRVRRYAPDGALLSSTGTYGSGPREVRSVGGIAESGDSLLLTDPRNARIQILRDDLSFIGALGALGAGVAPSGQILTSENGGLILPSNSGRTGDQVAAIARNGEALWSAFPTSDELDTEPYWRSVSRIRFTRIREKLIVTDGLLYPLAVLDANGRQIDSIGQPPPSYSKITSVGLGAFVGRRTPLALQQWFDEFTAIGGVHSIGDSTLVVVATRLTSSDTELVGQDDYALDIYAADLRKVYEDIPLPPGARVLGGGRHLYMLISAPPQPWRILRLTRRGQRDPVAWGRSSHSFSNPHRRGSDAHRIKMQVTQRVNSPNAQSPAAANPLRGPVFLHGPR